jgi:hypothetical protein
MAVCPACGSSRLRNGYRAAPLPLRLLGVRTLLCDNCNYEFRAFAPIAPKRQYSRRSQRKADIFNMAPAVDLQAIGQPGAARPVPAAIHFDRTALPTSPAETTVPADAPETEGKVANTLASNDDEDDDFAPPGLRAKIAEAPPSLPIEEPLMRLKEDLEERRSHSTSHACPACGEHEAVRRHRRAWEKLVFGLTQIRPYFCSNCGHQFYARRSKHRRQRGVLTQKEAEFVKSSCFNQEREEGVQEGLASGEQERKGNDG